MEQYLIDTNAVSDYFSVSLTDARIDFLDSLIDEIPNLSIITQIELLCWRTDTITEQKIKNFISDSNFLQIIPDVISQCVTLRRTKKIKTPDAIIAATALAYRFTLVTINTKDFGDIKGLKTINPKLMKKGGLWVTAK